MLFGGSGIPGNHHAVEIVQEPRYASSATRCQEGTLHDVALVRIDPPIRGIAFLPLGGTVHAGQVCEAIGYGTHGSVPPPHKFHGSVRVVSADPQGKIHVRWDNRIPRPGIPSIPGPGDSGGPLLCGGRIVGTFLNARRDGSCEANATCTMPAAVVDRIGDYESHSHERQFVADTLHRMASASSAAKKAPAKKAPAVKKAPARKSPPAKKPATKAPSKKAHAAKKAPARKAPPTEGKE